MAFALGPTVHPATQSLPRWPQSWRKTFTSFIAARQKQADIRVAKYLGGMPTDLVRRLDISPDVATALRDRER
jgi:hypothetical protein